MFRVLEFLEDLVGCQRFVSPASFRGCLNDSSESRDKLSQLINCYEERINHLLLLFGTNREYDGWPSLK